MPSVAAPRARRSFARLNKSLDVPNLIDIQRRSFDWLVDPEKGGLRETIDDISPIEDYTGHLAVQFGDFHFDEPAASIDECREKDLTYSRPLTVTVAFINHETGEIREQSVFMGDFPWMTERGTFIINGTERVVVTQLVRSPGAYLMEPEGPREAGLHGEPHAGPRLVARARDRQEGQGLRPHRPQAQAAGHGPPARDDLQPRDRRDRRRDPSRTSSASTRSCSTSSTTRLYLRNTIESDPDNTKTKKGALIELFKKQRPGEPPSVDAAYALLQQLFFDPKRYDLTRVGRYKLNSRLSLDIDLDTRTLTHDDIHALVQELVNLPEAARHPRGRRGRDQGLRGRGRHPMPREPVADHLDEYEHFGNRRLRTVGELIQEAFRIGLYRMERVVRERLTTEDEDTITPQTIVNIRPVVAALKEFFGSSQLCQFMDQTNSLAGLTHRRRLSAPSAPAASRASARRSRCATSTRPTTAACARSRRRRARTSA